MVPQITLGTKTYIRYDSYLDSANLQNLTLYALQAYIWSLVCDFESFFFLAPMLLKFTAR